MKQPELASEILTRQEGAAMKTLDLMPDILKREEAAAYLRICDATFDKLCKARNVPVIRAGRLKLYRKSDLLALAVTENEEQGA